MLTIRSLGELIYFKGARTDLGPNSGPASPSLSAPEGRRGEARSREYQCENFRVTKALA
jgi:hypothetical protein